MLLKLFEDLRDGNINPKQVLDNQASSPPPKTLKYWVGVQGANLTSKGEGASLALVGHPSINGVTIKMPYTPRI